MFTPNARSPASSAFLLVGDKIMDASSRSQSDDALGDNLGLSARYDALGDNLRLAPSISRAERKMYPRVCETHSTSRGARIWVHPRDEGGSEGSSFGRQGDRR